MEHIKEGYYKFNEIVIPARDGLALIVEPHDILRIVDLEGQQVADLVAYNAATFEERLSGTQTNKLNARLHFERDNILYSTDCNPMFRITEITNPLVHYSFLFSPCGQADNAIRFPFKPQGETCLSILQRVLSPFNIRKEDMLEPFSMGLNLCHMDDGSLQTLPPLSQAGDYIGLEVMMRCLVGISACPQDRNACNGYNPTPVGVEWLRKL